MTTEPNDALPLPGLEQYDGQRALGDVEKGVRRTLRALADLERLTEIDAGHLAVAVSLSRIIAKKEASGRLSTVSNDARLLVELLDSFVDDGEGGDVDEQLRKAMEEWKAYADSVEQEQGSP
jgi:hypothetical protein